MGLFFLIFTMKKILKNNLKEDVEFYESLFQAKEINTKEIFALKNKIKKELDRMSYNQIELYQHDIIKEINDYFGLDITEKTRKKEYIVPRAICSYIFFHKYKLSYQRIVHFYNLSSHLAAVHHIKNIIPNILNYDKKNKYIKDILFFFDKYKITLKK